MRKRSQPDEDVRGILLELDFPLMTALATVQREDFGAVGQPEGNGAGLTVRADGDGHRIIASLVSAA
jgi:hypothetical protein